MLERNQFFVLDKLSKTGLEKKPKKISDAEVEERRKKKEQEQRDLLKERSAQRIRRFKESQDATLSKQEMKLEDYRFDLDKKSLRFENTKERLDEQKIEMKKRMLREEEIKKAKVQENQ
jgi:hypothetical protein